MTADDSNEENSVREVGNCVKGSRIRNPVPPPTAGEDVFLEVSKRLHISSKFFHRRIAPPF